MALPSFAKTYKQLEAKKKLELAFPRDTVFSFPVVVRREDELYDGLFASQPAERGETGPRPFGWMLISMLSGEVSLLSYCKAADFILTSEYPLDKPVSMKLPDSTDPSKVSRMSADLFAVYDELREFAFEETLSREQVACIVRYKDLFMRLCPKGLYPFYHALAPSFFHWLRLPLPETPDLLVPPEKDAAEQYQYQLLILENLQMLVKQFQDKIAVDKHKEMLFDNLHKEVQEYKNGLLDGLARHMELDIISLIDGLERTLDSVSEADKDSPGATKLYNMLEGTRTDLMDILYRQGIDPYTCPGDTVDVARQTTVTTIPTDNPALDRKICARTARGWIKEDRVIRPERVSVYIHNET